MYALLMKVWQVAWLNHSETRKHLRAALDVAGDSSVADLTRTEAIYVYTINSKCGFSFPANLFLCRGQQTPVFRDLTLERARCIGKEGPKR